MRIFYRNMAPFVKSLNNFNVAQYVTEQREFSSRRIEIKGRRYPKVGFSYNEKVKEFAYIAKRSWGYFLVPNSAPTAVYEGDMIEILPNEMFAWEGEMEILVTSIPEWYESQQKRWVEGDA